MLWQILVAALLALSAGLHLWWRARLKHVQGASAANLERSWAEQQAAITRLQTRQETMLNSMTEGLLLLDERDHIQLANQALLRLFNVSHDITGKSIIEAFRSPELGELVVSLSQQAQVLGREIRIASPVERWLEANGAAIVDAHGKRDGAVLVFHDLTRLKQLESTRKDFVANVSHELRTPLSLIQGYVETLLGGAKDDPTTCKKFLETIERNAERLRLLIEDLLVISELESGRVKLDLQSVAFRPLVDKVLEDFAARAAERGVKLRAEVGDLILRTDPARLEQVLGNLIDNAIKYGHSGGQVIIAARRCDAEFAEISVQDNGSGIPPEALARVFERFYRADKARSREQGGTGLGLSIVKHIVQSHRGRVWAESKMGAGSKFYFTIPSETQP